MSAGVAYFPKPPRGPLDWLFDFVKRYDPRTLSGGALYAVVGLSIGFWLGSV